VILVFKVAEDTSKNPRTNDLVCWGFQQFVPPRALTAESFVAASVAKKNALLSCMADCTNSTSNSSVTSTRTLF